MSISRRRFLNSSAAVAAGFAGLRSCIATPQLHAESGEQNPESPGYGYGPLLPDPRGILSLPKGFAYRIISEAGREMNDGLLVPGLPDGMAALPGPYGLTVLIRNHELAPDDTGPYGDDRELFQNVPSAKIYDSGNGNTPGSGGTTTIVYDTIRQIVVREFLSLVGTARNCAGGATPWKTWITCEETVDRAGTQENYETEKDHGFNFEVPVHGRMELADPIPLTDMGRFRHEAVAVDPKTGIVYETEDRDDGLFYRFLPNQTGNLKAGGKLQALMVADQHGLDTRNWETSSICVGDELAAVWIDVDHVEAPDDDLRNRGFNAGAARFARGEGIWYGNGEFYFACTNGGEAKIGQIWKYIPTAAEGDDDEPGNLQLFLEPNDGELVENADNLTIAPWGDLILCEDRAGPVIRLVGVTTSGNIYPFAMTHLHSEFAGATFSPDGSTLFVNIQGAGLTLAITGPWQA